MPNGDLEEQYVELAALANRFAGRFGVRFTDEAAGQLQEVVVPALERMSVQGQLDDEATRRGVENALLRLIFEAYEVADVSDKGIGVRYWRQRGEQEFLAIRGEDVSTALLRLCPGFWPFC